MDDLLLDLFPPTNDFSSTDADIPFDAWIAQFDAFADEPPEPAQTQVPLIEELPEEESTLAPEPSMDSPSHPPKLLPSGPIESSARRRKPLYKPTCAILINSKRVNKKPMEKGNNVYGRTGTLRCELCRKRRLKCTFTSIDEPCELCRKTGITECMKILGPKKASSTSVSSVLLFSDNQRARLFSPYMSKPVPGLDYDPNLRPRDRYLLQIDIYHHLSYFAFFGVTDPFRYSLVVHTCFRLFGRSVNHPSLRPALCAWIQSSSCSLDILGNRSALEYLSEAQTSLIQRLGMPGRLDIGDFLASFLLAIVESFPWIQDPVSNVHLNGCINLGNSLSTSSGLSVTHFPRDCLIAMKEILFTGVKYYPKWKPKRKTLVSSFFRAFSTGDLSLTPNCLNAEPNAAVDLNIAVLEVFYRLRDILEANANRPVQHSFDPDSNDGFEVRQIAAYLDTTHGNGSLTLVQSLIDPGLTLFADGWVTSHLKLYFSSPRFIVQPYIRASFENSVYLQFTRLLASALGSSSLFNGLCSSAFQQSVDVLSTYLRHVLGVVENMYLYVRSNFHLFKPERYHVGPDLIADFDQVRTNVFEICHEARTIWTHCEETISFILELMESCTGEPRSNYIHDCFNRLERIHEELITGTILGGDYC